MLSISRTPEGRVRIKGMMAEALADEQMAEDAAWEARRLAYPAARPKSRAQIKAERIARRQQSSPHRRRKNAMDNAKVRWADQRKIRSLYATARVMTAISGVPHHVDHIVPLQGESVCGLHWEGNLQILTARENCRKGNRLVA